MPCYEWQCPECGRQEETFPATPSASVAPVCQHGAALTTMERVPSAPKPHALTGVSEKRRRGDMITRRNNDYWNSKVGREQYQDSPRIDLTKLSDTQPRGE